MIWYRDPSAYPLPQGAAPGMMAAYKARQVAEARALLQMYADYELDAETAVRRATRILMAPPSATSGERMLGIRPGEIPPAGL